MAAPVPVSASVVGNVITVVFDQNLDPASVPPPSQFAVDRNGGANAVSSVTVPGNQNVVLIVATPYVSGDTGSVTYTRV